MRYLFLALLLVGCSNQVEPITKKYPGTQPVYGMCHTIWLQGYYDLDVKKCEDKLENPKFKLGTKVRYSEYDDKGCFALVVGNGKWSWKKSEAIYTLRIYCWKDRMHDEFCEKGNWLNCPSALESELRKYR